MNIRLRSTRLLLLPSAVLIVVPHHVYREDTVWDTILGSAGLVLLIAATGGRIGASAYIAGNKNESLIVDGSYSMVRNPLYLFSLIGFAGA